MLILFPVKELQNKALFLNQCVGGLLFWNNFLNHMSFYFRRFLIQLCTGSFYNSVKNQHVPEIVGDENKSSFEPCNNLNGLFPAPEGLGF